MKILITGFNGFIGTPLTRKLLEDGHHIVGVSSRKSTNDSFHHQNLQVIQGAYSEFDKYETLSQDLDLIIHLAYSTVPENSTLYPDQDIASNVIPSLDLIRFLQQKKAKKMIFISSGGVVYGNPDVFPTPESATLKPISSYGISKMIIERNLELLSAQNGFECCILRMSNIYGEGHSDKRNQGVINIWLEKLRKNNPIEIFGDAEIVRDYIFMEDVVNAIREVINKNIKGVFNIGTSIGTSLEEILLLLEKVTGLHPMVHRLEGRKYDVSRNILSYQAFHKATGWHPAISIEEGIRRLSLIP